MYNINIYEGYGAPLPDTVRILLVEKDVLTTQRIKNLLRQSAKFKYTLTTQEMCGKGIGQITGLYDVCLVQRCTACAVDQIAHLKKSMERTQHTPVIIMLDNLDDENKVIYTDISAQRAGVYCYLTKDELTGSLLERTIRYGLTNARILQDIKQLAFYDDLTQLYSRKYFMHRLTEFIAAYDRYGILFSFCFCDIDNLTTVNNSQGHPQGDSVLRAFGKCVTKALRANDIAGRMGGDEFCFIFPHTEATSAAVCIEKIRERFVAATGVSASFGLVTYESNWTIERTIYEADKALYAAKHAGKNQTSTVTRPLPPDAQHIPVAVGSDLTPEI